MMANVTKNEHKSNSSIVKIRIFNRRLTEATLRQAVTAVKIYYFELLFFQNKNLIVIKTFFFL